MPSWWPGTRLREAGVVSMNMRNAQYISRYNSRRYYPLVDDKLRTKELALKAGIAVPKLYGVIEIERQIRQLPEMIRYHSEFVVKPVHGSGGNGILVIAGRTKNGFRKSSGVPMSEEALEHHISNILSGMYSLGGTPDRAMIEYRVRFDPIFEPVSFAGVPDIRTIVFKGMPVACMIRLPTRASDGKANLHQGAVGAGVDMATGMAMYGVCRDKLVNDHPDTGHPIRGVHIPEWPTLLETAARCRDLVGLDYLGVDIVLDEDLGPLVLELNARPGLSIQLANHLGLQKRLSAIEQMQSLPESAMERATLAMQMFGHEGGAESLLEAGAGVQKRLF